MLDSTFKYFSVRPERRRRGPKNCESLWVGRNFSSCLAINNTKLLRALDRGYATRVESLCELKLPCCAPVAKHKPTPTEIFYDRKSSEPRLLKMTCCAALLFLMPASALAETSGKIPRDVIDYTAAHGGALVLVSLAVPWQLESRLEPRGPARAAHRHRLDTKRPPG